MTLHLNKHWLKINTTSNIHYQEVEFKLKSDQWTTKCTWHIDSFNNFEIVILPTQIVLQLHLNHNHTQLQHKDTALHSDTKHM